MRMAVALHELLGALVFFKPVLKVLVEKLL